MSDLDCEWADHHPAIEARLEGFDMRLTALEQEVQRKAEHRVNDFKEFTTKLETVHEKINSVALTMAGLNGKLAMFGLLTTAAGALALFFIQAFWGHATKIAP